MSVLGTPARDVEKVARWAPFESIHGVRLAMHRNARRQKGRACVPDHVLILFGMGCWGGGGADNFMEMRDGVRCVMESLLWVSGLEGRIVAQPCTRSSGAQGFFSLVTDVAAGNGVLHMMMRVFLGGLLLCSTNPTPLEPRFG